MGDAPVPNLDDFFNKKKKKQLKGLNLNNASTSAKTEDKKSKLKSQEEEEWQEEQVVAATIQVAAPGRFIRDEDSKPDEDEPRRAWGNAKGKSDASSAVKDLKKNPTPAMSVQSSTNINIDDGSNPTVNIKTSKNVFSALEDHQDDDEEAANRRPKEIVPARVQKQKGEREKVAIQREVDKFGGKKDDDKKDEGKKKKEGGARKKKEREVAEEGSGDEDEDEDGAEAEAAEDGAEEPKKPKKKAKEPEKADPEPNDEEDQSIKPDLVASRAKYQDRKRLPLKELPKEEYQDRVVKKQPVAPKSSKKKGPIEDFDIKSLDAKPGKNRTLQEMPDDF